MKIEAMRAEFDRVLNPRKSLDAQIYSETHIVQILEGFARTATPMNIVSSARNSGIDRVLEKRAGPTGDMICHPLCKVNPETCWCLLTNAFDTEEMVAATITEEEDSQFEPEEDHDGESATDLAA
jgi:hypothetical protein